MYWIVSKEWVGVVNEGTAHPSHYGVTHWVSAVPLRDAKNRGDWSYRTYGCFQTCEEAEERLLTILRQDGELLYLNMALLSEEEWEEENGAPVPTWGDVVRRQVHIGAADWLYPIERELRSRLAGGERPDTLAAELERMALTETTPAGIKLYGTLEYLQSLADIG